VSWIVDPIDGTVNFIYGIPAYAVSIAAQVEGRVVAGVVCNIATGEEFSAQLGGGARLVERDGTSHTLRVPDLDDLSQALVATGFGYEASGRMQQASSVTSLIGQIRDIRRIGSAALDLCFFAAGRVDAYVERGTQPVGPRRRRPGGAGGRWRGHRAGRRRARQRLLVAGPASLHPQLRAAAIASGF
jgi:myo-inositol-1(or 4)-monophosphatase